MLYIKVFKHVFIGITVEPMRNICRTSTFETEPAVRAHEEISVWVFSSFPLPTCWSKKLQPGCLQCHPNRSGLHVTLFHVIIIEVELTITIQRT